MSLFSSRRWFLSGAATTLLTPEAAAAPASTGDVGARLAGLDADVAAISHYVREKLGAPVSVKDFGAIGDGASDDTPAFQAAIDVATSFGNTYTSIYIPPGKYRLTNTIRLNKRHIRLFGVGDKSCLYFDPPANNMTMILVQHSDPAELINYVVLESFSFISNYTGLAMSYAKTGIKLCDASLVTIRNVNVLDYSWTSGAAPGTSIGIHMCGRDTHAVEKCVLLADKPIYADLNPNSNEWQFDCHSFRDLYLQPLMSGGKGIEFAPGVNPTNWYMTGSVSVSGDGGIYLNNQGKAALTSSQIHISHFRCEGGAGNGVGSGGGYGIYMDFGSGNPACANMTLEHCSVNDPTCNGFLLKGVSALKVDHLNGGFGAVNAFIIDRVNQLEIFSLGVGNVSATVTLTDMYAQRLHKISGGPPTNKSIGYGYFTRYDSDNPGSNLVYENGVRKWSRSQVLNDGDEMPLPSLAAGGSMMVNVSSDFGAATYSATPRDTFELNATPDWSAKVRLVSDGAGRTTLVNVRAGTRRFVVTTHGS